MVLDHVSACAGIRVKRTMCTVAKQGQTIASDLVHGDSGLWSSIFVVFEPVCFLLRRQLGISSLKRGQGFGLSYD
jgi:hypothetical protein